jgi:hypothetical protein
VHRNPDSIVAGLTLYRKAADSLLGLKPERTLAARGAKALAPLVWLASFDAGLAGRDLAPPV